VSVRIINDDLLNGLPSMAQNQLQLLYKKLFIVIRGYDLMV